MSLARVQAVMSEPMSFTHPQTEYASISAPSTACTPWLAPASAAGAAQIPAVSITPSATVFPISSVNSSAMNSTPAGVWICRLTVAPPTVPSTQNRYSPPLIITSEPAAEALEARVYCVSSARRTGMAYSYDSG